MDAAASGDVTIDLASSTVTGNSAQGATASAGGGLHLEASAGTTRTTIRNTILSGNLGGNPECAAVLPSSGGVISIISQGFNIFGSTMGCTIAAGQGDISSTDTLLGPLAENGGPTQTHALLPGSVAIDGGNPAGCLGQNGGSLPEDQRGMPRVSNGRCDIGAYEK
jgi:hypothetical protein